MNYHIFYQIEPTDKSQEMVLEDKRSVIAFLESIEFCSVTIVKGNLSESEGLGGK